MKKISLFFVMILGALVIAGCTNNEPSYSETTLDTFAQCLTQANVKMYGTPTCGYCQKQRALFGESFKYVQYIDCIANPTMCSNIATVPTWLFADGSVLNGLQTLEALSAKTNCALPK